MQKRYANPSVHTSRAQLYITDIEGYVIESVHRRQTCKLGGIRIDAVVYPLMGTIGKALVLTL
jgi:hypothetical protein